MDGPKVTIDEFVTDVTFERKPTREEKQAQFYPPHGAIYQALLDRGYVDKEGIYLARSTYKYIANATKKHTDGRYHLVILWRVKMPVM
jgi:hypothetical protein